jgi:hypothetical protein
MHPTPTSCHRARHDARIRLLPPCSPRRDPEPPARTSTGSLCCHIKGSSLLCYHIRLRTSSDSRGLVLDGAHFGASLAAVGGSSVVAPHRISRHRLRSSVVAAAAAAAIFAVRVRRAIRRLHALRDRRLVVPVGRGAGRRGEHLHARQACTRSAIAALSYLWGEGRDAVVSTCMPGRPARAPRSPPCRTLHHRARAGTHLPRSRAQSEPSEAISRNQATLHHRACAGTHLPRSRAPRRAA